MPYTALDYAQQVLTSTGTFGNTQTVTVGGKVYTFQTTLTDVDGNVLIGASAAASLQNLYDAINLTGTPGTQYADSMTANDHVQAIAVDATTLTVASKVPGEIGNLIASTETQTNASWGAATLAGGAGSIHDALNELLDTEQMPAALEQYLHDLSDPAVAE